MSQEQIKENFSAKKIAAESPAENLNAEEITANLTEPENSGQVDNLPLEAIGSYARLEELLTDEEAENASHTSSQN